MTRTRLILLCLLATFTFATATASASAFSWWIETEGKGNGAWAGEKEFFNPESIVGVPLKFKWTGAGVKVEVVCKGVTYEEAFIEGLTGLGAKSVHFETCKVEKPVNCEISPAIVSTSELVGNIKEITGSLKVAFELKPKTGTLFMKLTFQGASCLIKGQSAEVKGTAGGEITNPKELSKEKAFFIQTKLGTLAVGGTPLEEGEGKPGYSATKGWGAH